MSYTSHPSAVIDDGVSIGDGSRIWHFVHVCSGATIGRNVVLGQNVFVGSKARIGDDCKVQNNVSIYDAVILEDGVFCGPSVVFTNVRNPRARVERKSEYSVTRIRSGASLGANCTIVCGADIGRFAFIGAGAVVTHDVPDHGMVAGVPARLIGWMSRFGERLSLPLVGDGEATCPATGERFKLENGQCRLVHE